MSLYISTVFLPFLKLGVLGHRSLQARHQKLGQLSLEKYHEVEVERRFPNNHRQRKENIISKLLL